MSEDIKKELDEARAESKAKSEFLSMVTHQLRTPMSGIKWIFQMLLSGDFGSFNEEQRKIIEKGAESSERMIKLLQEVMTANQNNEWDFQYSFQKVDMAHLIESVITEFLEEARVANVVVSFEHPTKPLPLIDADPEKITLVLENLVENAIKYSPDGSYVYIRTHVTDDTVTIAIQDHGMGIPEDQKERVFEKFFRADNVREKRTEGTGLGLFTAQNIISKHGGKLWFHSAVDRGTTFHCELPINQ
jgi:signal transduction histidine kinase